MNFSNSPTSISSGVSPNVVPSAQELQRAWEQNPRWRNLQRTYSADQVVSFRSSMNIEFSLARQGAHRLWEMLNNEPYIHALGAVTGNQAVQQVSAGLRSVYVSGWQVAADANLACQTYPDQSLYPANSVPMLVRRINQALLRADQISMLENNQNGRNWFVPLMADAEAGFGGPLNAYEIMREMIEAGAAGVHFEDQLSSAKKCGHLGGKVLVPMQEAINKLIAARLAADVCGVPTVICARTDAYSANLLTSDIDERDHTFLTGERTEEGFFRINGGLPCAIARGLAFAPYCDLIWCETSNPNLDEAAQFATAIHARFPGKFLAYNCSPSFNWKLHLDVDTIARFQRELGAMGYKYQFVTLAGFHALNLSMFTLALDYSKNGMAAYSRLQEEEFELERRENYKAIKHQKFVGTGLFDNLMTTITGGRSSVTALEGSTEKSQFEEAAA